MLPPLPIDPHIPEIVAGVRNRRALVVTAPPGAGKTTRIPPALAADGPVLVLQPRRIAARSIAQRIAAEQGWTAGREVGWQVRFERRFTGNTRVLLATEGILTARAQSDPLLSGFRTIVLDEFHERSIHADLGIALARQAWLARSDLRLVVMSATMDAGAVAGYLDGCPIVEVDGAAHPVRILYMPEVPMPHAVASTLAATDGQVLCFLPGAPEIRRAAGEVGSALEGSGVSVVQLHGSLSPAEQDAAIAQAPGRRVILATNVAETSLTVPGVHGVVDSGLHKVARYDPNRAIDSLDTERISQDAADQRAGRAGRLGPGVVVRLWRAADRLRPHREADVHRIDICAAALQIYTWGGNPRTFEWFERPAEESLEGACALLTRLGAINGDRPTALGRRMGDIPLHPRLARVMLSAGSAREAAVACALLSERQFRAPPAGQRETTTNDLPASLDDAGPVSAHLQRVAQSVHDSAGGSRAPLAEADLRRALLAGYPDRVAKRRSSGSDRFVLASGHGAVLGRESGVRGAEFVLALDVAAGRRGETSEAVIRLACAVEREWLEPTRVEVVHELQHGSGRVRASERQCYDALVLGERPARVDPAQEQAMLAQAYLSAPRTARDERLLRRLRFAGLDQDFETLAVAACGDSRSLQDVDVAAQLPWAERRELDRLAPEALLVPSGRAVTLDYLADGAVVAGVKLQELFGLAETPRIGPRSTPVVFELRAPNGRAVQMTSDLRSFWRRTYPEVRRELRGRYPRHPWPEDPWSATPTGRTVRRTG